MMVLLYQVLLYHACVQHVHFVFKLLEWLMAAVWAATFDMKQSC